MLSKKKKEGRKRAKSKNSKHFGKIVIFEKRILNNRLKKKAGGKRAQKKSALQIRK